MKNRFRLVTAVLALMVCATLIFSLSACDPAEPQKEVPLKYVNEWNADMGFDESECVQLEKREGAPLRVLQLTDVHFDDHNDKKEGTLALIQAMIEQNNPDLITLTGDWVSTSSNMNREERSRAVFDTIEAYSIPWAPVFGNHDAEGELSKYDFADIFAEYEHCVFKTGYSNLKGVGNYIIEIKENGKLVQAVFMLDSHSAVEKGSTKYDYIGKSQIAWYEWAVEGLNEIYRQDEGKLESVPSLAYFHIPLVEFKEYKNAAGTENILIGANREGIASGYKNSGLFASLKKMKSTKGVFCGHDHDNNAAIVKDSIVLAYGVESGWCKDYATGSQKGALIADFYNDASLYITHSYFDMARYPSDKNA